MRRPSERHRWPSTLPHATHVHAWAILSCSRQREGRYGGHRMRNPDPTSTFVRYLDYNSMCFIAGRSPLYFVEEVTIDAIPKTLLSILAVLCLDDHIQLKRTLGPLTAKVSNLCQPHAPFFFRHPVS